MDVLAYALRYANRCWHVLPVSEGKHAGSVLGTGWQTKSSTNPKQIEKWFTSTDYDCAVHLGPISGIIDIESDTKEGNQYANDMLGHLKTPTFVSSRSTHRIFQWDDRLLSLDRIKYEIHGVEYRVGRNDSDGNPMGCISVFPPSESRQWVQPLGECPPARLPQFVVDVLLAEADRKKRPLPVTPYEYQPNGSSDVPKRAAAYVDKIPRTQCGTASCHDRTFQVACNLIIDFGLSIDSARPILQWWSNGGEHVWLEKEIEHKLSQATAKPDQRGRLLADRGRLTDVDLSGIVDVKSVEIDEIEPALIIADFPTDCLMGNGGLIQDIVTHNLETAMYPQPECALASAIALVASITGRKITDEFGTRTNCYLLAMAPSGSGKEHGRKLNKTILVDSGGECLVGPERIGSSAGLITTLTSQPSSLLQLDEIGRLLQTMKNPGKSPHLYNIATVLMQLYSSSDTVWVGDAYADAKKVKRISQPNPVVLGTTVPESFWGSLTTENLTDGLLGRLMVFESSVGYSRFTTPANIELPRRIIDQAGFWLNDPSRRGNLSHEHPTPLVFRHTPEAHKRFVGHITTIAHRREQDEADTAAIWSRSGEKAAKLALIFAAARQPVQVDHEIDLQDVNRAIAIANWMTRTVIARSIDNVAGSRYEDDANKMVRLVKKQRKWISRQKFAQLCRWLPVRYRNEILSDMIDSGRIRIKECSPNGQKTTLIC